MVSNPSCIYFRAFQNSDQALEALDLSFKGRLEVAMTVVWCYRLTLIWPCLTNLNDVETFGSFKEE